ncbi:MAG: hypothetical protein ACLFR1_12735 [Spirochaetia bacterium]
MKRILIFLVISIITIGAAAAQEVEPIEVPAGTPQSPEVMAQGGSFAAISHGYNSLFTNPAGFSRSPSEFTLTSLSLWLYGNGPKLINLDGSDFNDENGEVSTGAILDLADSLIQSGTGFGFSGGLGWAGGGVGLGLYSTGDFLVRGENLLGANGYLIWTNGLVAGLSFELNLLGINFHLGGDVRPEIRTFTNMNSNTMGTLIGAMNSGGSPEDALMQLPALQGFGLGIDVGTIAELGPFTAALSIRDLFGTQYAFRQTSIQEIADEGGIVEGTELAKDAPPFVTPMNLSFGASFNPDLGALSFLIDPMVHLELHDAIEVLSEGRSPWNLLHLGGEVKLLRFIRVRGGINQGYFTAGAGVHLLFLDVNAGVFTRSLGRLATDYPNTGFTVEAAIRF